MNWLRSKPQVSKEGEIAPEAPEPEPVKLPSKWDITLYDGGDVIAKFEDIRDIEKDGFKISFDDSTGFGHEFFGFDYRLDERV